MSFWLDRRLGLAPRATSIHGSAARFLLVEEWLWEAAARLDPLSEGAFRSWLEATAQSDLQEEARVRDLRRCSGLEALDLWHTVRGAGSHAREGEGGAFSSSFYLSAASMCWTWEIPRTYRLFSSFSTLDAGSGRATSGLLAALVARAVAEPPYRAGFSAWFFNALGRILAELRRVPWEASGKQEHRLWLEEIEDLVVESYEEGAAQRTSPATSPTMWGGEATEEEFGEVESRAAESGEPEFREEGPVDPHTLWRRLAFALSFAGQDLLRGFRALDPTDVLDRRAAQILSLLVGAWFGFEALDEQFGGELAQAEEALCRHLGVDPAERGEMFYELSRVQSMVSAVDEEASRNPEVARDPASFKSVTIAP